MIRTLIISGGSTKTIAVLGAVQYLEEQNKISNVINYVGTSAGSMLCFFLSLGYSIHEILDILKTDFFGENLHALDMDELLNLNITNSYGMDSGNQIVSFMQQVMYTKLKRQEATFLEYAKITGKNLVVCVANITKKTSEHLSVDTYPNLNVIDALRMSIGIPFLFTPIRYNDCFYVDGGIYESFPLSYVNQYTDPLQDTIAINTVLKQENKNIDNFLDYVSRIIHTIVEKANNTDITSSKLHIVNIEFDKGNIASFAFDKMRFDIDMEEMYENIKKGYNVMKLHFEK